MNAWVAVPCLGRYVPSMPFKHNAARRHRISRARYRVTNWPAYEAGLCRRGDLTLWLDEAALAGWAAPKRSSPGGQPRYFDLAIELVLTVRLVFHLALRQAEAFIAWTSLMTSPRLTSATWPVRPNSAHCLTAFTESAPELANATASAPDDCAVRR